MSKTKVKISGVEAIANRLKYSISNALKDDQILRDAAVLVKDQIKKRTQAGLEEYKQPPLTKNTIARRESLMKSGNRSDISKIKAKTSALTLTGQLLNSITYNINAAASKITFSLLPNRRPYIGSRKLELENKKSNKEIKEDLEKQGRRFFFISKDLIARLQVSFNTALRKKLAEYRRLK